MTKFQTVRDERYNPPWVIDAALYAQGARCGHLEGRGRAGSYVIEEEVDLSLVAADGQGIEMSTYRADWAAGYRHGYRLAAEGSDLDAVLRDG